MRPVAPEIKTVEQPVQLQDCQYDGLVGGVTLDLSYLCGHGRIIFGQSVAYSVQCYFSKF